MLHCTCRREIAALTGAATFPNKIMLALGTIVFGANVSGSVRTSHESSFSCKTGLLYAKSLEIMRWNISRCFRLCEFVKTQTLLPSFKIDYHLYVESSINAVKFWQYVFFSVFSLLSTVPLTWAREPFAKASVINPFASTFASFYRLHWEALALGSPGVNPRSTTFFVWKKVFTRRCHLTKSPDFCEHG